MSGKIRPSLREKTLKNVAWCNLSQTDKNCIKQVFDKFEEQQAEIERLQKKQDLFADIGKMHSEIKAEAVKDLMIRLTMYFARYRAKDTITIEEMFKLIQKIAEEAVGDD